MQLIDDEIEVINAKYPMHAGWTPIAEKMYLMTTWREPASRTVSHFIHSKGILEKMPSKEELFKWVEENKKVMSDYQSRNILFESKDFLNLEKKGLFPEEDLLFMAPVMDRTKVWERINKINLILKWDSGSTWNFDIIGKKLADDLWLREKWSDKIGSSPLITSNKFSKELYKSLNKSEIDLLNKISPLDYEIYNSDIFWKEI